MMWAAMKMSRQLLHREEGRISMYGKACTCLSNFGERSSLIWWIYAIYLIEYELIVINFVIILVVIVLRFDSEY